MMLKHFMPIVAGLMLAGVASAQESTTTPPTPPTPPVPPQIFRHMEVFTSGGGFLGVVPGDVTPDNMKSLGLSEEYGVVLNDVLDDTPAKSAGLQKNDVVIGWNGTRVESAAQLRRLIHETPVGRSVKIDYIRGGSRQSADVKIAEQKMPDMQEIMKDLPEGLKLENGELPKGMIFKDGELPNGMTFKEGELPNEMKFEFNGDEFMKGMGMNGSGVTVFTAIGGSRMGAQLQSVSPQLAKYFGLNDRSGALVGSIDEKSAAADAGLQAGDVITAIDGTPVASPVDAMKILGDRPEGDVKVTVIRDRKERTLTVKLPKQEKGMGIFNGSCNKTLKFRFRNDAQQPSAPQAPAVPDTQSKKDGDAKLSQLVPSAQDH